MRIVFITDDLSSNSTGRTLVLWMLAEKLGWTSRVFSTRGEAIWAPLEGTSFAEASRRLDVGQLAENEAVREADLIISVKPKPGSFGVALQLAKAVRKPLLLDIDDPDLEYVLSWHDPFRRLAKGLLRRDRISTAKRLRSLARQVPTIVSNPVLQALYGGPIIPHAREDSGLGSDHVSSSPLVSFVGTAQRSHKGVGVLRSAVAKLQSEGFRLVVTDDAPPDAAAWENWTGATSLIAGRNIVAASDIVVIPSLNLPLAQGQLPAKLMDAMMLGRAIVVSDIEPMPWAIGEAGICVKPGAVNELIEALASLRNPSLRSELGLKARERGVAMFSVEASLKVFEEVVVDTIRAHVWSRG